MIWNIPTLEEVERERSSLGISRSELSRRLGSHTSLWHNAVRRGPSAPTLRDAVSELGDAGSDRADDWCVPTVEEVESEREDRGVGTTHFSTAIGYSYGACWPNACRRGHEVSIERLLWASAVLDFHDRRGYLPAGELEPCPICGAPDEPDGRLSACRRCGVVSSSEGGSTVVVGPLPDRDR